MLGVGTTGPTGVASMEPGRRRPDSPHPSPSAADPRPRADERDAWAVLAGVRGLGPVGFGALLARYGTAIAILREAASVGGTARLADVLNDLEGGRSRGDRVSDDVAAGIAAATETAEATLERIRELGLTIVTLDDPAFPSRLASIDMPPHVLYVLGDLAALDTPAAVAVVGTRRATDHGRAVASRLATNLAAVGACVVSGLAVGIDGAAHAAALHAGGTTVAVIGSGHATVHPRAHTTLAGRIVAVGWRHRLGARPGRRPDQGHVPAAQPDHQRSVRCDGRGRGTGSQRSVDHGLLGTRAGT